jgi:type VI secretion system secreted protein Hcp
MENVMENVIVSIGRGGGVPTKAVTFNYGKITTIYTKQARHDGVGAGEVPAGWNLEDNSHC